MTTGRRIIILVRHGDYESTITFPANPDGHLNEKGKKQSAAVAERLKTMNIDAIHSSSLMRARETTDIIAAHHPNVPLSIDEGLQECIPPIPPALANLFEHIPADFIASGPPQAEAAFAKYFTPIAEDAPNRLEVVVSHGNLLGYFVCRVFNAPKDSWLAADFGNCAISQIRIRPDGFMKLLYHNDNEHLPLELRSEV
jgi:serine/threonine-protein phosphatase PGAM5